MVSAAGRSRGRRGCGREWWLSATTATLDGSRRDRTAAFHRDEAMTAGT